MLDSLLRIQVGSTYSPVLVQQFIMPQQLHRALYAPVVRKVSKLVTNSYLDVLPGLPYTELPVITMMDGPPTVHTMDVIML